MKWSTEKPKKWKECVMITASFYEDQGWEYTLWEVKKIEFDDKWYWGLVCADGEEWGDIDELSADLYATFRPLKIKNKELQ